MNIYSKHFSRSLCTINHKYCNKRVITADLGGYCLFLHKAGFRRLRHKIYICQIERVPVDCTIPRYY